MSATEAAPAATTPHAHDHVGLYPRLLKVCAAIGHVPQNGWNAAQSYNYVREGDLIDAVRGALLHEGLLLMPSLESVETRETTRVDRASGQVTPGQAITRVIVVWTFIDVATGTTHSVRAVGDGADSGDKGVYKALTGALKYTLRQAFLIATGDDAEDDGGSPRSGGAAPTGAQSATPRQAPPAGRPPVPAPQRQGGGGRLATDGQRRMLFARARASGLSDQERDHYIQAVAQVPNLDAVPMDAVDALLTAFDNHARQAPPPGSASSSALTQGDVPQSDFPYDPPPLPAAGDDEDIPFLCDGFPSYEARRVHASRW
jgi:hypothetical protein